MVNFTLGTEVLRQHTGKDTSRSYGRESAEHRQTLQDLRLKPREQARKERQTTAYEEQVKIQQQQVDLQKKKAETEAAYAENIGKQYEKVFGASKDMEFVQFGRVPQGGLPASVATGNPALDQMTNENLHKRVASANTYGAGGRNSPRATAQRVRAAAGAPGLPPAAREDLAKLAIEYDKLANANTKDRREALNVLDGAMEHISDLVNTGNVEEAERFLAATVQEFPSLSEALPDDVNKVAALAKLAEDRNDPVTGRETGFDRASGRWITTSYRRSGASKRTVHARGYEPTSVYNARSTTEELVFKTAGATKERVEEAARSNDADEKAWARKMYQKVLDVHINRFEKQGDPFMSGMPGVQQPTPMPSEKDLNALNTELKRLDTKKRELRDKPAAKSMEPGSSSKTLEEKTSIPVPIEPLVSDKIEKALLAQAIAQREQAPAAQAYAVAVRGVLDTWHKKSREDRLDDARSLLEDGHLVGKTVPAVYAWLQNIYTDATKKEKK